jgi:hypothetical protein
MFPVFVWMRVRPARCEEVEVRVEFGKPTPTTPSFPARAERRFEGKRF